MIPQITKETPPYVRFEEMEHGLNAEASEKAGRPIPAVKAMAIIMQRGSKDEHHAVAEEWLAFIRGMAVRGEYPSAWSDRFHAEFEAFKKGGEMPENGTPIRTWPALKVEQVKRVLAFNIRTVEELADLPDSAVMTLGLDGRNMRDLAKAYIADGKGSAGSAKRIADLEEANRRKDDEIGRLAASVAALEAQQKKKAA